MSIKKNCYSVVLRYSVVIAVSLFVSYLGISSFLRLIDEDYRGGIAYAVTSGGADITKTHRDGMYKYKYECLTDAAGDCTSYLNGAGGYISAVRIFSDAAPALTASFDVTLKNTDGFDYLDSLGLNLSNSATHWFVPNMTDNITELSIEYPFAENLTLTIENGGAAKQGTIEIYKINVPR